MILTVQQLTSRSDFILLHKARQNMQKLIAGLFIALLFIFVLFQAQAAAQAPTLRVGIYNNPQILARLDAHPVQWKQQADSPYLSEWLEGSQSRAPWWLSGVIGGVVAWIVLSSVTILILRRRIGVRTRALQESNDYLRAVLDAVGDAIFVDDADSGAIIDVNRGVREMYGYTPEEVRRISINSLSQGDPPYSQAEAMEWLGKARELGPQTFEWLARHKDGHLFWVEVRMRFAVIGAKNRFVVLVRDITAQKHSEDALRRSEAKYRRLFETSVVGIFSSTSDGRFLDVNPTFARIIGHASPQELVSSVSNIATQYYVNPEDRVRYQELLKKQGHVENFEFRVRCKDGSVKWVSNNTRACFDESGEFTHYEGVVLDTTARKGAEEEREKLQAQLLQSQKMESIARLAGGVAHDFNNMLGVILGHTELAMAKADPQAPLQENLNQIFSAARRSADITHQLLAFARKQTIAPQVLNLNETVEGMLKMLRRLIGEEIDMRWRPGKNLAPVLMDPSQLDQILANLCVNARDAIMDTGRISIETGAAAFDEDYCAAHDGFVPGTYVLLAVSDDGTGIEKEALANIFDPFFTTKQVGKGTGLGLATVYGIVKQNNGFIHVYSEPGEGSRFTIYLPRYEGEAAPPGYLASLETPAARGTETILLVEDEPAILEVARMMLERVGYTVLAVSAPAEGLRLAGSYEARIDLLMTDVIMPGMNGRELSRQITALRPDIRVLFMSGYTADAISHHGVLDPGFHFIQKPFSVKDLAAAIRRVFQPE